MNIDISQIVTANRLGYEVGRLRTAGDLDLRSRTGCTIIGFKTAENDYVINPESETILIRDSNLIVLGRPNQIRKLREIL